MPLGHGLHELWPPLTWNVFAAQLVHDPAFPPLLLLPAAQLVHDVGAPACPDGQ